MMAKARVCLRFLFQWNDHLYTRWRVEMKPKIDRLYRKGLRETMRGGVSSKERREAQIIQATVQYLRDQLAKKDELKEQAMKKGMSEAEFKQIYRNVENQHQSKLQADHDSGIASPSQVSEAMDTESHREDEETPEQDVGSRENERAKIDTAIQ